MVLVGSTSAEAVAGLAGNSPEEAGLVAEVLGSILVPTFYYVFTGIIVGRSVVAILVCDAVRCDATTLK